MNILKFIPKRVNENYEKNIINAGIKASLEKYILKVFFIGLIFSVFVSIILAFFKIRPIVPFIATFLAMEVILYFRVSLLATTRIRKIESVFPDFIQLVSSNLRAGMTVDRAFFSSARAELAPLDEEILRTGREIATGEDVILAFRDMAKRINSEKIEKIIFLIISGLKAGGNISTLLETTGSNMREKEFLEKRAASNVLMYVIFISVAIGFGAPLLFGLSSILVEILIKLTGQMPAAQSAAMSLPFTLSTINISSNFVIYFSLVFLVVIDVISSLVIGLVSKGEEKYGLNYIFPFIALSIGIFFATRLFLYQFLSGIFSAVS